MRFLPKLRRGCRKRFGGGIPCHKRKAFPEVYGKVFRLCKRRSVVTENTAPAEAGVAGRGGAGNGPPRVRADAQRNIDSLLQAAKAVFDSSGVDAPAKEIADLAGVGVGTVYRHFPKRSDLVKAVVRSGIDACADAGPALSAAHEPGEAL